MVNGKRKGKAGELEAVRLCKSEGYECHRMCEIKDMFFEPEEECVEYHPRKSEYVNLKSNCLHLWRPNDGREFINPLREAKERLEEDRQAAMERWGL